jgi:hypothetical protein
VTHGFLDVRLIHVVLGEDIVRTLWCSEQWLSHRKERRTSLALASILSGERLSEKSESAKK